MYNVGIIIAGSRDFNDYPLLETTMDNLISEKSWKKEEIIVLSGHARGADDKGEKYAYSHGIACKTMIAQWDKYGKGAGHERNRRMALDVITYKEAMLVAFWDGRSSGTRNMINTAKELGIATKVVYYNQ